MKNPYSCGIVALIVVMSENSHECAGSKVLYGIGEIVFLKCYIFLFFKIFIWKYIQNNLIFIYFKFIFI
jgi:hypothetical protein